eukprot:Nk52_evm7s299 gene=Nk52_evmTU7s299
METLFEEVEVDLYLPIAPVYLNNVREGITRYLNHHFLWKYREEIGSGGVVVGYNNISIANPQEGKIMEDGCFVFVTVNCKLLSFAPRVGLKLCGIVNKIGIDYIGLVVMGTFNASISSQMIPERYQCDPETMIWYASEEERKWEEEEEQQQNEQKQAGRRKILKTAELKEGVEICFEVCKIDVVDNVVALEGSMLGEGTGVTGRVLGEEEVGEDEERDGHEQENKEIEGKANKKKTPSSRKRVLSYNESPSATREEAQDSPQVTSPASCMVKTAKDSSSKKQKKKKRKVGEDA